MRNGVLLTVVFCLLFGISACAQRSETGKTTTEPKKKTEKLNREDPIKVGETAPDFSLTTAGDEKITLSEINKSTMLVFYRGHW